MKILEFGFLKRLNSRKLVQDLPYPAVRPVVPADAFAAGGIGKNGSRNCCKSADVSAVANWTLF